MTHEDLRKTQPAGRYAVQLFQGDSCRLWGLAEEGRDVQLPAEPVNLDQDKLVAPKSGIVFGERRAGSSAFAEWWLRQLAGRLAVVVHAQDARLSWSSRVNEAQRNLLQPAIGALINSDDAAEGHALFTKALTAAMLDGAHLWLFLRHLAEQDKPERVRRLLSLLRADVEAVAARLHVWVSTSWLEPVSDRLESSGLLSVANAYRMPLLDSAAIERAAGGAVDERLADEIGEQTGGQPLLVQRLVEALRGGCEGRTPSLDDVRRAAFELRASPPQVVELWQEQLRVLVTRYPKLQPILEAYLQGRSIVLDARARGSLAPEERHLFIAGWVGPNHQGSRWGIRSPLHRAWAQKVLHSLGSGRR